jgi:hypothetical protein
VPTSPSVVRTIHTALGDLASKGAVVAQPKKEVLDAAARTGDHRFPFLFIAASASSRASCCS